MNISDLEKTDKGRWVSYTPRGCPGATDIGRITSWNNVYVFVRFAHTRRPHWDNISDERTPMGCLPETLAFIATPPGLEGYLVWSFEHRAWWRGMCSGYTRDVVEAGRYSLEQARDICITANQYLPEDKPNEVLVPEDELAEFLESGVAE
jgi:hypothetical protein